MQNSKSNGLVLFEGISKLDNTTPIVVIATGLQRPSRNEKTGDMIQTWILRQDVPPHEAAHSGQDTAICGDCPLTKLLDDNGIKLRSRRCYVETQNAPQQVWYAWRRGTYPTLDSSNRQLFRGRKLRIGAYGDPVACPLSIWSNLIRLSDGWTGYTHQWRQRRFWRFKRYVMASCENRQDHESASKLGWRTFTTAEKPGLGQITCPNSTHGVQCADCNLCSGQSTRAKSITIPPHGGKAIMSAWKHAKTTYQA